MRDLRKWYVREDRKFPFEGNFQDPKLSEPHSEILYTENLEHKKPRPWKLVKKYF